eukprot:581951-Prymnesium_polylepis.2
MRLLRARDRSVEEVYEPLERVGIHVIKPVQLSHTEEERARKCGRRSVRLAQLADLRLRLLRLAPRGADLAPERLGLSQPCDGRRVLEDRAALARGERVQDVVLLDLELLLVRGHLAHPLLVPRAEVGPLLGNQGAEQLLLERGW